MKQNLALKKEEARLRAQAKSLRAAANLLDLAATYWGDGAYETAKERINMAAVETRGVIQYMDRKQWMTKI